MELSPASQTSEAAVKAIEDQEPEDGIKEKRDVSNDETREGSGEDKATPEPPFSIFSTTEKKLIMITISFIGLISPLTASIYLPAVNTLASSLNVSLPDINLTITTYMIFQALAPTLFGNLSDTHGRRPAYILCFLIYIAADIGLALQKSYMALMILRCVQSSGSSETVAMGSAVVADLSTPDKRGKWMAYSSMGIFLGPSLGPLIGGLLDTYLGWRAIFWFLAIFGAFMMSITLLFLPETARAVVGNGSMVPQRWNRTVWSLVRGKKSSGQAQTLQRVKKRPNPIESLRVVLQKEDVLILLYGAVLYAGFYVVMVTLTPELQSRYGFNTLQVGLCYIPLGVGSMVSRFTIGLLLDRNYKRLQLQTDSATPENRTVSKNSEAFPIEKARLQIGISAVFASAAVILIYAWVLKFHTSLAGPLIMLFFCGNFATGTFNILSTLVLDLNQHRPATAVAANNLARCLLGAAFTAFAQPLIDVIGVGWTGTFVAGLWVLMTPALFAVMKWGPQWREEKREGAEGK